METSSEPLSSASLARFIVCLGIVISSCCADSPKGHVTTRYSLSIACTWGWRFSISANAEIESPLRASSGTQSLPGLKSSLLSSHTNFSGFRFSPFRINTSDMHLNSQQVFCDLFAFGNMISHTFYC